MLKFIKNKTEKDEKCSEYEKNVLNLKEEFEELKNNYSKLHDEMNILKIENEKLFKANKELNKKINEKDNSKITEMQSDIKTLNTKITQIKNKEKNIDKILNSYNDQFKTIFIDSELKPRGLLKYFQELETELILFVTNICKKYNLECWLDCGTLLGAVRHGGFIPWDDDIDMGMMRKDFNNFREIFDNEIKLLNLENNITWSIDVIATETWVQSFIKIYYFVKSGAYVGLDIFPYDYLIEETENTKKYYEEEEHDFHKKILDGGSRVDAEKEYFDKLGLSYEPTELIIPGVDGVRGSAPEEYDFDILKTESIFPLNNIKVHDRELYCPKDYDYYLKSLYGDYFQIPKIIHHHDVISKMHTIPDAEKYYKSNSEKLRQINDDYF